MHDRLHWWHRDGLCHSPYVQHVTPLLTLGNQKILKGWDVLNTEIKTKKKTRFGPCLHTLHSVRLRFHSVVLSLYSVCIIFAFGFI